MDLFRPYLETGNGHQAAARPEVRREEEKEPERLYDEAVGETGARTKPSNTHHDYRRRLRMGKKSRNALRLRLRASRRRAGGRAESHPARRRLRLYGHKNADSMQTRNWHGFYWARQNEEGDYEIRTVPVSSGEYSAPGGVWPIEGSRETTLG
jgi:hypothetical protein